MQCIIKEYKLVWTQGNRVFSTMHDTLAEAKKQQSIVVGPTMIMKLRSSSSGEYEWVLVPSIWAWLAKNYVAAFIALLFMGVGIGYAIKSGFEPKNKKEK